MMVNSDVDGFSKTLNYRTIIKNKKLLKSKRILKPKYKLIGGPSFRFSLQKGTIRHSGSSS